MISNEADARHYDLSAWNEHLYGAQQHVMPWSGFHGQGLCSIAFLGKELVQ